MYEISKLEGLASRLHPGNAMSKLSQLIRAADPLELLLSAGILGVLTATFITMGMGLL